MSVCGITAGRIRTVLDIAADVEQAVSNHRPADRVLAERFRAHREYGSRDRRFYAAAVFALFRWRGWCGSFATEGPNALIRAHWLDVAEPNPVFRAWATELGLPYADAPGWGGLPPADRARAWADAEGRSESPDLVDLVPDWLPAALAAEAGAVADWIAAFQVRPPLWLRAVGTTGPELCDRLRERGWGAHVHPVRREAVLLDGHPHLANLAKELNPCFLVQDLASQAVIACAAPRPGEHWWDACAGSGGKALALADKIGDRGRVLATDRRPEAVREMKRRMQARPAAEGKPVARVRDAGNPPTGAGFDGVLLDAPCSGIGTWPRNPDARWRTKPAYLDACAQAQHRLLLGASNAVRPGGRLVYAVCTVSHQETRDRIQAFCEQRREYEPVPTPAPLGGAPACEHWIHAATHRCSGMYIAVLRRTR